MNLSVLKRSIGNGPSKAWQLAQREELRFWEGISRTGYNEQDPERFIQDGQRQWLLSQLEILEKPLTSWQQGVIVEFGPGPAGFVEYLPAKRKIGIEPLIEEYRALYPHLELSDVEYYPVPAEEAFDIPSGIADLVVCFNMLDHVISPTRVVAEMSRIAKPGADLLFQLNVYLSVEEVLQKPAEHAALHPHSFFPPDVVGLLDTHGFQIVKDHCSPGVNPCGEHYFICAGKRL